jgi:hypothetical protein
MVTGWWRVWQVGEGTLSPAVPVGLCCLSMWLPVVLLGKTNSGMSPFTRTPWDGGDGSQAVGSPQSEKTEKKHLEWKNSLNSTFPHSCYNSLAAFFVVVKYAWPEIDHFNHLSVLGTLSTVTLLYNVTAIHLQKFLMKQNWNSAPIQQ